MSNDYFQFKQFLIKQDKCAMKVCTDVCLFGAWAAEKVSGFQFPVYHCLDIGTGTGLLSLMLAQKNKDLIIDAVEIDKAAALQANENFKASQFKQRLKVYHNYIQRFALLANKKFDVIICNPPFYENDLKSLNQQRNVALHSDELILEELISVVKILIKEDGNFFVLLPYHRSKHFEKLLQQYSLFVREKVFLRQTLKHHYFRTIFWIDRKAEHGILSEIIITDIENEYSNKFKELLKDYYLKLS